MSPLLPAAWLEHMQKAAGGTAKMELDRAQARAIIDQMPTGDPCRHVQAAAGAAIGLGAVHELFRPAILKVVAAGRSGCPGAAAALVGMHRAFLAEKTYGPEGKPRNEAESEWHRLLDGAIGIAGNDPQGTMCVDRQMDWIDEIRDFDDAWEPIPAIDWSKLWEDETVEEWFCEPLLAKRRLVALYSPPKVGKSLLMLEMAAAIATGRPMFGYSDPPESTSVLYVDFENDPRGDIRTRLQAMGYGPDDLALLHLLSFPTLAALDSERGSIELMRNLAHHQAEVLIIDTVSRAIAGEENDNDTWLKFYRHTGLKLKQAGIAMIRLDHSGKDVFRGQRGGSAKSGDVDAVWRLSQIDDGSFQLECEAKRFQISETSLTLTREVSPWLRHTINPFAIDDSWKRKISAALIDLDAHGIDPELGARKAYEALQKLGKPHSARSVKDAQSRRRVGNQAEMG